MLEELSHIFVHNKWDWIFFLGLIAFGTYAAIKIKNEKDLYHETAIPMHFHGLELLLPAWWGKKSESSTQIVFERQDTYYDWSALFKWVETNEVQSKSLKEIFANEVAPLKIVFDPETTEVEPDYVDVEDAECLRVEGTATQDEEDRLYYDACIIRFKDKNAYLFCQSKSSVLNGSLEGPYFEEVLKSIKRV